MALVDTEEHRDTVTATVGVRLIEALAARDFTRMSEYFEPSATMRALLPSGLVECQGPRQIVENVRSWFGDTEELELLDSTHGEVGDRLLVTWRFRLHPTPWGDDAWHVIEQHAYLRAGERIEAIDLLCSGFHPEGRS
jgi:SnoaL-like protein